MAGAIKLASSKIVPFLWDDPAYFTVIEKLTLLAFNQVNQARSLKFDKVMQLITRPLKSEETHCPA